jgi:hypothetical protein
MRKTGRRFQIPLWVKIFALLFVLSVVVTVLGPLAEALIPAALFVTLVMFPGPNRDQPRLVRAMPWLWGFSFVVAAALALSRAIGKPLFGETMREVSTYEIWSTIAFTGPLIWTLVKRHWAFRWIIAVSAVITLVGEYLDYSTSTGDAGAMITLISGMATELALAIYLFVKFKPQRK